MEEKLDKIIDKMEIQHQELLHKFNRHVDFIDETYEGLRNPLRAARKFFGNR